MLNWINFVVLCGTSAPQRTAAHFNEFILLNFISQFFHCIYILFMQFQRVVVVVAAAAGLVVAVAIFRILHNICFIAFDIN